MYKNFDYLRRMEKGIDLDAKCYIQTRSLSVMHSSAEELYFLSLRFILSFSSPVIHGVHGPRSSPYRISSPAISQT